MTAKELHEQKIIPLRKELRKLEAEYRELYRKECGEKIGERASCRNCAMSCITISDDFHNRCMDGKCTCCNDWCYSWIPENNVSRFLRDHYSSSSSKFYRLEDVFGSGFLEKCTTPEKENIVMEMLELMAKMDGHEV